MKSFAGIGLNYCKTIKSSIDDKNKEFVFAETNIVFHEPEYNLLNTGKVEKSVKVGELEIMLTLDSATSIRDTMNEIIEFIENYQGQQIK